MHDLADFAVDLRSEGYAPTTIRTYVSMLSRPLPFTLPGTAREVKALKRWLRRRESHEFADAPELFLGKRGPLTANGLGQRMEVLSARFGISPPLACHQFRRSLAHRWVEAGGADDSLMSIGGWTDSKMPSRYRSEFVAERALVDYRRLMTTSAMKSKIKIVRPGRRKAE